MPHQMPAAVNLLMGLHFTVSNAQLPYMRLSDIRLHRQSELPQLLSVICAPLSLVKPLLLGLMSAACQRVVHFLLLSQLLLASMWVKAHTYLVSGLLCFRAGLFNCQSIQALRRPHKCRSKPAHPAATAQEHHQHKPQPAPRRGRGAAADQLSFGRLQLSAGGLGSSCSGSAQTKSCTLGESLRMCCCTGPSSGGGWVGG